MASTISTQLLVCVFLIKYASSTNGITSDMFQREVCSNPRYETILKAASVKETSQNSTLQCAISCGRNDQCNFAVFRQSVNRCTHIHSYDGIATDSLPAYTDEPGCYVLRKNNVPVCENHGTFPGQGVCVCPPDYRGVECEEAWPAHCRASSWKIVSSPQDYQTMSDSQFESKLLLSTGATKTIYHVTWCGFNNPTTTFQFQLQAFGFLAIDSSAQTFHTPLKIEYKYHTASATASAVVAYSIDMTGAATYAIEPSLGLKIVMRDSLDSNRIYHTSVTGESLIPLIEGLRRGYRLMYRDAIRVGIDDVHRDVYYGGEQVGASGTRLNTPLYYFCYRLSTKHNRMYILRQTIQTGTPLSTTTTTSTVNSELDRCWTRLPSYLRALETTELLKDIVLSGGEIRLVMNGSIATDITMVTVTTTDIVVALAKYLTPFLATSPLSDRVRFSLLSASKTLVYCQMVFMGSTVDEVVDSSYASTLDWVVSSRPWTKIFQIQADGTALFGTSQNVTDAASSFQNIRVCVEKSNDVSECFGSLTLTLTEDGHVLFQTPAALGSKFNSDWSFSGIVDSSSCTRYVWLVSTKGRVERAAYVIGQPDPPDAVVSEPFLTITWFRQD